MKLSKEDIKKFGTADEKKLLESDYYEVSSELSASRGRIVDAIMDLSFKLSDCDELKSTILDELGYFNKCFDNYKELNDNLHPTYDYNHKVVNIIAGLLQEVKEPFDMKLLDILDSEDEKGDSNNEV